MTFILVTFAVIMLLYAAIYFPISLIYGYLGFVKVGFMHWRKPSPYLQQIVKEATLCGLRDAILVLILYLFIYFLIFTALIEHGYVS
jgi:hypothetical protein